MEHTNLVDPFSLPSLTPEDWRDLPHAPGVYFVLDGTAQVVMYIGQSYSIRRRLSGHAYRRQFLAVPSVRVAWHLMPYEELPRQEVLMIAMYRPPMNTAKGGNRRLVTEAAAYEATAFRLPPDVFNALRALAKARHRTLNMQAILCLRDALGVPEPDDEDERARRATPAP